MNLGPAWSLVSSSPWIFALVFLGATVVVSRSYLRLRWVHVELRGRDKQRRFSGGMRQEILSRAGGRCEHHYLFLIRCGARGNLEADHVHPHSRGGSTSMRNGQALCKMHNRFKGARIPFTWELRRLESLRSTYFPEGCEVKVVRKEAGASKGQSASR